MIRPEENTRVSTNMPKNIRVGRSEILFIFLSTFYILISGQNCFLGLIFNKINIKPINNEEQSM